MSKRRPRSKSEHELYKAIAETGDGPERTAEEDRRLLEQWRELGAKGTSMNARFEALLGFLVRLGAEIEEAHAVAEAEQSAFDGRGKARAAVAAKVKARDVGGSFAAHMREVIHPDVEALQRFGRARAMERHGMEILDRICAAVFAPPKRPTVGQIADLLEDVLRSEREVLEVERLELGAGGSDLAGGSAVARSMAHVADVVAKVLPEVAPVLATDLGQRALRDALTARPATKGAPRKGDTRPSAAAADTWLLRLLGVASTGDARRKSRARRIRTRRSP